MKKVKKFLFSICFIALFMLFINSNTMISNASFMSNAKNLVSQGGAGGNIATSVAKELLPIGQMLTYIGAGLLVAATAYLGVQYIISPPDKQGVLKEKLIALVVAGVVIFGAYSIWKQVVDIFKDL